MLSKTRLLKFVTGCLLAFAVSSAHAQQSNPPTGAVRSHYSQPQPIVVNPPPPAAPVYRTEQPPMIAPLVAPATLEEPARLPPREAQLAPIPLAPRGASSGKALLRTPTSGWGALSSVGASLGLVLGAFLCVAWLSKRYLPKGAGPLPKEVVEQLGWAPLAGRQQMQLVRLGNKLVLLAVTPGSSAEPLAEVTDQAEVERLTAICGRGKSTSSTRAFREVISELEREPARGFVESQPRVTRPTTNVTARSTLPPRPNPGRPTHG